MRCVSVIESMQVKCQIFYIPLPPEPLIFSPEWVTVLSKQQQKYDGQYPQNNNNGEKIKTKNWLFLKECMTSHKQMIFLERTREGHHQSDEHWNCFKGDDGETSERWDGAHNYGLFQAHRHYLELNWTELWMDSNHPSWVMRLGWLPQGSRTCCHRVKFSSSSPCVFCWQPKKQKNWPSWPKAHPPVSKMVEF